MNLSIFRCILKNSAKFLPAAAASVRFSCFCRNHVLNCFQSIRLGSSQSSGENSMSLTNPYWISVCLFCLFSSGEQLVREGRGATPHQTRRLLRAVHQGRHCSNQSKHNLLLCRHFRLRINKTL